MLKNKLEHIAFILDGNKRWAKKNNVTLKSAYKNGLQSILNLKKKKKIKKKIIRIKNN